MTSVKAVLRLLVPAQNAKPGPAIGQALGPHGLNMSEFVKTFNAATQSVPADTPVPVVLTAFTNRTFTFITKTPPASYLIKKELGLEKGSSTPGNQIVGKITYEQIKAIAAIKHVDAHVQHIPFDSFCRCIAGSAKSMGVDLVPTEEFDFSSQNTRKKERMAKITDNFVPNTNVMGIPTA